MTAAIVYVTVSNPADALTIGRRLVEERLAACANVLPAMTSVYRWNDQIEQAEEAVLLVKSRQERVEELISRIKALHSYEVPCIVSWTIQNGNPDYLQWIDDETMARHASRLE